jgi:hypothetical protein
MYTEFKLLKSAPDGDYPIRDGIVVRTGNTKATLCTWNTVAACLRDALKVSPELRQFVREALTEAELSIDTTQKEG